VDAVTKSQVTLRGSAGQVDLDGLSFDGALRAPASA
jgi:hypothetical protein